MKITNKQRPAWVASIIGAALLTGFTPQLHAQTAVDQLLNKLEQKGILTAHEARQLKEENQKDTAKQEISPEHKSMFHIPKWVTGYKFSGDLRGRIDDQASDNSSFVNRLRFRYRLRIRMRVDLQDNMQLGFSLASDDGAGSGASGGDPLSNNSTFAGNASKKFIYINTAFAKWTPIHNDDWMLSSTIGKMENPFQLSWMEFDPDYRPEGAAIQSAYNLNDRQSLKFNGAAFVLDEIATSSRDPFMYGAQLLWISRWTPRFNSSLSLSTLGIANKDTLKSTYVPATAGNTLTPSGSFADNYNPIIVGGNLTWFLDSFPLYNGRFPITLAGEYMNNPSAASNNEGWWTGVVFGKSGKKGTWDLTYRYQRLEADAWWDQVVNDDNIAYLPGTGMVSGTNIKGHLVMLDYSVTDYLTCSFTCYVNSLINNPGPTTSQALHAIADIMWRF